MATGDWAPACPNCGWWFDPCTGTWKPPVHTHWEIPKEQIISETLVMPSEEADDGV